MIGTLLRTIIFFLVPGIALVVIKWEWEEPTLMVFASALRFIGWALIVIGVLFFFFRTRKAKQKQKESRVRERINALGDSAQLAYRKTEPLTDHDRRTLNRKLYVMGVVLVLFASIPFVCVLFVDGEAKVILLVFAGTWLLVIGMIGVHGYNNYSTTLRNGVKEVLRGIVTDRFKKYETTRVRRETSTQVTYFLKVGDQEVQISLTMYRHYAIGDAVEFQYAEMNFFGRKAQPMFFAHQKIEGASVPD